MKNVLFTTGMIAGALSFVIMFVFVVAEVFNSIEKGLMVRRQARALFKRDKLRAIFAVRIPCAKHNYTPVAYVYARAGEQTPVVTIYNHGFFKKLLPESEVICVAGDVGKTYKIKTVQHIRNLHAAYTKSITI